MTDERLAQIAYEFGGTCAHDELLDEVRTLREGLHAALEEALDLQAAIDRVRTDDSPLFLALARGEVTVADLERLWLAVAPRPGGGS